MTAGVGGDDDTNNCSTGSQSLVVIELAGEPHSLVRVTVDMLPRVVSSTEMVDDVTDMEVLDSPAQ